MSERAVAEYAAAVRGRYGRATKREKGAILDEFCRVTGDHRKAAIRLLGERAPRYGPEVVEPLRRAWEAADRPCGKRGIVVGRPSRAGRPRRALSAARVASPVA